MSAPAFIAGDWGTSNLRLHLCAADGRVIDGCTGPGAAQSRGRFPEVFDGMVAPWRAEHGILPTVLCGMAGSAFGWREAPYLLCPEELDSVGLTLTRPRADIAIVPGMRCSNPLGAPDVMRGEETQLLGALALDAALAHGHHLICLPGTHTKWVALHDGVVLDFLTVPTGELFALLCQHSVLVRDPSTPIEHHAHDFTRGLAEATRHMEIPLLHRLFQSRSLRLDQQLSAEGAASWTSGLLIGTDVNGALPMFASHEAAPVHVIGDARLCELYGNALERQGRRAQRIDGSAASLSGLARIHSTSLDHAEHSSP